LGIKQLHNENVSYWLAHGIDLYNDTSLEPSFNITTPVMDFFTPQLQIISDLHLETPMTNSQYTQIDLEVTGSALLLLGDIGLVRHDGLFVFLRNLLDQNRGCRIFYILGNHEAYQTTLENAVNRMRYFEEIVRQDYGGRFRLLFRDRYDLNDKITILGCTLWSNIQPDQAAEVGSRMTDYNEERGIRDWTPERSCKEHARDLAWLNAQVERIQSSEPHRSIFIATHHCPTIDARATDPRHAASSMNSGFVSDLSKELCWTSPAVKVWAFGHTHYSCAFRDEVTDMLIVSNQKGYGGVAGSGVRGRRIKSVIVEQRGDMWVVVDEAQSSRQTE
jgi:predicted phosphodiesterase